MQNSKIEWTHHTFNIVWGCQKVSPGCANCYAETLAHRYGYEVWGPAKTTERRTMAENYWKQPRRWNDQAATKGERARVFCGSMCDVFEDHPLVEEQRERLFELIGSTIHLDWLLLTKRPENISSMIPSAWLQLGCPENIWLGTSVEDQQRADERIPHLLRVPARIRFLSCEPLLGPLDLATWFWSAMTDDKKCAISWVIAGGESGHGARPMHPDWARSLRDQCAAANVPLFVKQMGSVWAHENGFGHKGGEWNDLPDDLRIRQFPEVGHAI